MHVNALQLRNFCCFDERSFDLADRFTLLVGDNGTGKSSILNGLSVALGAAFLGFPHPAKARGIERDEVRLKTFLHGRTMTSERQFPVRVTATGEFDGEQNTWERELTAIDGRTTRQGAKWIQARAAQLSRDVTEGRKVVLPIISCYGTGRLWLQMRYREVKPLPVASRFMGYLDCLNPASDEERLLAWFKTNEMVAIQRGERIGVLEAVRRAILDCIGDARRIYFDVSRDQLILQFEHRELPFHYLSDGYRNMLAMVADVAERCATLNPFLQEKAARETPGVVLIDEIDLHLHPKWQGRVVEDLLRAFPKVQFVATTHSPFIIQSLPPRLDVRLLNLDNPEAADFANKSVEDIAEQVQGVENPQRSQRYQEMMNAAERYFQTLDQAQAANGDELVRLKDELDRLSSRFSDDPAYQALLKVEREARLRERNGDHAPG